MVVAVAQGESLSVGAVGGKNEEGPTEARRGKKRMAGALMINELR